MKKIATFLVTIILVTLTTVPIKAENSTKYEERQHLSIYDKNIREHVNGHIIDSNSICKLTGECHCYQKYHLLENSTKEDFYSVFFNSEQLNYVPFEGIYQDASDSMTKNFSYETKKITENISTVLNEKQLKIKPVFANSKTNLYGLIGSFCNDDVFSPNETIIIISDLWDTSKIENEFYYYGNLIFCVPYNSRDQEAVLHCEDVVNKLIYDHNGFGLGGEDSIDIYIVYMDKTIVKYSNGSFNASNGYIEILVP